MPSPDGTLDQLAEYERLHERPDRGRVASGVDGLGVPAQPVVQQGCGVTDLVRGKPVIGCRELVVDRGELVRVAPISGYQPTAVRTHPNAGHVLYGAQLGDDCFPHRQVTAPRDDVGVQVEG